MTTTKPIRGKRSQQPTTALLTTRKTWPSLHSLVSLSDLEEMASSSLTLPRRSTYVPSEYLDTLHVVSSGAMMLVNRHLSSDAIRTVRFLGPQDQLYVTAPGDDDPYDYYAEAINLTRVLLVSKESFSRLLVRFPELAVVALSAVGTHFTELERFALGRMTQQPLFHLLDALGGLALILGKASGFKYIDINARVGIELFAYSIGFSSQRTHSLLAQLREQEVLYGVWPKLTLAVVPYNSLWISLRHSLGGDRHAGHA